MKKALVIVSFGTTYERARRSIDAVERALAQAAEGKIILDTRNICPLDGVYKL